MRTFNFPSSSPVLNIKVLFLLWSTPILNQLPIGEPHEWERELTNSHMSIRLDHQSHPIIPTINLATCAGKNPSLYPNTSLVNFDTIKQLNCLFRYKLRAHWSSKQKMQSLSSLLTGPSDHFNCPCTTYGDFLYDDIWLVEKVAHKTNLGWCFPGSSLLMMLIRIGQSSAAHERLIKSGWVELGNRGW